MEADIYVHRVIIDAIENKGIIRTAYEIADNPKWKDLNNRNKYSHAIQSLMDVGIVEDVDDIKKLNSIFNGLIKNKKYNSVLLNNIERYFKSLKNKKVKNWLLDYGSDVKKQIDFKRIE